MNTRRPQRSRRLIGATPLDDRRCNFRVWAPDRQRVSVKLGSDSDCRSLARDEDGHFSETFDGIGHGTVYSLVLDDRTERPDPASRLQLEGVHGPSRVVDLSYPWRDTAWRGMPLSRYVIYELHVGAFSKAGTFAAILPELERLKRLGITAIELMPVAQFPGTRNWGYDGVYPYAVQDSYGGPRELQRLVDECHHVGLSVILDVVYNHFGPEGCYLADFGPYFTDAYKTPWGKAINFDGPHNGAVREFFIGNALQWIEDFHFDALRLDAVHAIFDRSAVPFLEQLAQEVHAAAEELGRYVYLIGESDLNDPRVVSPSSVGGLGLDSMWCDDFHHAAHALLTGERSGYYLDFGTVEDLARAFRHGMSHAGQYSRFRKRVHGRAGAALQTRQCVVCVQNHDQVGNRFFGERLSTLVGFESQKLAAAILCFAPFLPLLFMGQEYGELAPFQYWVSHGDAALLEAVREGRKREFAAFLLADAPDPAHPEVFERCVLRHELRASGQHATLYRFYQALLRLRGLVIPASPIETIAFEQQASLLVEYGKHYWAAFCFSPTPTRLHAPIAPGNWTRLLASADSDWEGPGTESPTSVDTAGELELSIAPQSFVVYATPGNGQ